MSSGTAVVSRDVSALFCLRAVRYPAVLWLSGLLESMLAFVPFLLRRLLCLLPFVLREFRLSSDFCYLNDSHNSATCSLSCSRTHWSYSER